MRVVSAYTLAFPSHDGNGMFKSLGNDQANAKAGMLFIDFEQPKRLRVNGRASIEFDDPLLASYAGVQLVVRVRAERVFWNCPRYIHRMPLSQISEYAPAPGLVPPVPAWKQMNAFCDYLPQSS